MTPQLTYKDLMVALQTAGYRNSYESGSNFYSGRKYILNAKTMLNLDEAVLREANNRNWELDQLEDWASSQEAFRATLNWIDEGGNGFTTFFNNVKAEI